MRGVLFLQPPAMCVIRKRGGGGEVVGASGSPSGVYALSGFVVHRVRVSYIEFCSLSCSIRLLVMLLYAGMNLWSPSLTLRLCRP